MDGDRISWGSLPPEIRNEIIGLLPSLGGRCSQLATVCQAWRSILEPRNFAEISLTVPRLADPNSQALLLRKRNQIRYIWFRVELREYDCRRCGIAGDDFGLMDDIDYQLIVGAFQSLFTTLGAWEPRGDLVLDISVYSPSDSHHWFKYLSFCPDTNQGECPSLYEHEHRTALVNDPFHGWSAGQRVNFTNTNAIESIFDDIMGDGPFNDYDSEMEWWRRLPLVPVVGVVLLRQQTRRRWKPLALSNMLTRFPNMTELCYEPWTEWCTEIEQDTDQQTQTLIKSFHRTHLRKLTIFENFNEYYAQAYQEQDFDVLISRVLDPAVSQKLARASLHLTILSASFMVDADYFFAACKASWTWDKLTSLALTSRVLTSDADPLEIDTMFRNAASAAFHMPKLDTMEIWNGSRGVAMLFRYQRAQHGHPAIITTRGTSSLDLSAAVTRAWDAVVDKHGQSSLIVQPCSLIDPDEIQCHGDAIRELELLNQVIRPISLRQIISEHRFRA
ncbi:hypothetical protein ARSEF4850_004931 [Beauveria asiatica]